MRVALCVVLYNKMGCLVLLSKDADPPQGVSHGGSQLLPGEVEELVGCAWPGRQGLARAWGPVVVVLLLGGTRSQSCNGERREEGRWCFCLPFFSAEVEVLPGAWAWSLALYLMPLGSTSRSSRESWLVPISFLVPRECLLGRAS